MRQNRLNAEEVARFQQDGFLGPYTLIKPDEMAAVRDRLQSLIDDQSCEETIASQVTPRGGEGRPLRALYDQHLTHPDVYRLAAHPQIVAWARALLSDNLLLWRSTFWIKEPFARRLEWHQDTYKDEGFGSFPNLNVWIAIDEATLDNGVRLIAGTHRTLIDPERFRSDGYVRRLQADDDLPPPPVAAEARITTMALRPGECFLFDGRVLHGSPPNRTSVRRAGMVTRFIPVGTRLAGLRGRCVLVSGSDDGHYPLADPPRY